MSVERCPYTFLVGDPIPYIGVVPINPRSSYLLRHLFILLEYFPALF